MKTKKQPTVPSEVTAEQWEIIDKIAVRLAKKYTFGYYDVEDIEQQARIEGLQGLVAYDENQGPLENFLAVHIRNRLHNFKRDNFFRPDQPKNKKSLEKWEKKTTAKKNILEPLSIHNMDEHFSFLENHIDKLAFEELITTINEKLPTNLRTDFLRLNANVQIPQVRRERVQAAITEILEEISNAT